MIMDRMTMAALLSVAVAGASCDACDDDPDDIVEVAVDEDTDFTAFQTFSLSWNALSEGEQESLPADVRTDLTLVEDAVRSELMARGLSEVPAAQTADLVVVSLASTDDEQALSWACAPGTWWGYWDWTWDPCAWLTPLYVEYEVGTVAIGLVDTESQAVPFGGVIEGVLDDDEDIEERIQRDVERMFEDYPAEQTGAAP